MRRSDESRPHAGRHDPPRTGRAGLHCGRAGRSRTSPSQHCGPHRSAADAEQDGSLRTIFNGEIYNHASIRAELERDGHVYRTSSDTETIVHAYEQWGEECVHRFRGMFAFAIWDSRRRRLFLVRDRLGVTPLYWCMAGTTLLFASEIKAILASGLIEPETNRAALPELLGTRSIAGEDTLFRGIRKLLPGHWLVFEDGVARTQQYWDLPARDVVRPPTSDPDAGARLASCSRVRPPPADGGRSARRVPVWRDRQQCDRVGDGAARVGPLKTFSVAFKEHAYRARILAAGRARDRGGTV